MNELPFEILKMIWKRVIFVYSTKEETTYNNNNYMTINKLQSNIFLYTLKKIVEKLPSIVTKLTLMAQDGIFNSKGIQFPGMDTKDDLKFEILFKTKQSKENLGGDYIIYKYKKQCENNHKKDINENQILLGKFLIGFFPSNLGGYSFAAYKKENFSIEKIINTYKKIYSRPNSDFPNFNCIGIYYKRGYVKVIRGEDD